MKRYVRAINEILENDNITLTYTTIEGALINENSLHLFERWICDKYLNKMKYNGCNHKPSKLFAAYKKDLDSGKKKNYEVINKMLSINFYELELTASELCFIKETTINHLKECKKTIRRFTKSKNEILNIYRVVFEGKTDTLLSRLNESYNTVVHSDVIDIVKAIRVDYLATLGPIMGKTGGWVTDFLNFAIDDINETCEVPNDFYRKFSFYFPELSDIIKKVSSAIV